MNHSELGRAYLALGAYFQLAVAKQLPTREVIAFHANTVSASTCYNGRDAKLLNAYSALQEFHRKAVECRMPSDEIFAAHTEALRESFHYLEVGMWPTSKKHQ